MSDRTEARKLAEKREELRREADRKALEAKRALDTYRKAVSDFKEAVVESTDPERAPRSRAMADAAVMEAEKSSRALARSWVALD